MKVIIRYWMGGAGAVQAHDEGAAGGGSRSSSGKTLVVAFPVIHGHYNQGTKETHSRRGGRTGNSRGIRLKERNPAPETKRNP